MNTSLLSNTHQSWPRSSDIASSEFTAQWIRPGDIFSVLLILGGDVIQLACAAMASGSSIPPNPVTFSFGWVAYSVSSLLLSAIGSNRLISFPPEIELKVINLKSGAQRSNNSWLLGRFVKTYSYWMPPEVRPCHSNKTVRSKSVDEENTFAGNEKPLSALLDVPYALCVAVYCWREDSSPGIPTRDLVWWSGYIVSLIQLGIATIPLCLYGDWAILLAIGSGTILAYSSASLPQWRKEKWNSRRSKMPIALMQGNGVHHVIIIDGGYNGLDLEALAAGLRVIDSRSTRISIFLLSFLWLALLVSCTGIRANTWYLLATGGIVLKRSDLESEEGEVFAEPKVMWTLMRLELKYKGYGKIFLNEFFPGKLLDWEKEWWASDDVDAKNTLLSRARDKFEAKLKNEKEEKLKGSLVETWSQRLRIILLLGCLNEAAQRTAVRIHVSDCLCKDYICHTL
ncbi:hypothetical protein PT974_00968 [Cladobotryum mycophilum]|uniref:Uncharacterized protein n=1 Tax=Cladobotryum mycophilum TaxID=491253 RepID=A0ABR0T2K0_9HYPO